MSSGLIAFEYGGREVVMPDSKGIIASHYRIGTFYEGHMLYAIEDQAREGVYVDVGANVGNHTTFFEMFCASTKVIAFEPADHAWPLLLETRRTNHLSFEAHKIGLSDSPGEVTAYLDGKQFTFPTQRLDDLHIDDVAVVKIDIEGMEAAALTGMTSTLTNWRPHLYIEARSGADLSAQETIVGPIRYIRTGRVWNSSPTYEWVHVDWAG